MIRRSTTCTTVWPTSAIRSITTRWLPARSDPTPPGHCLPSRPSGASTNTERSTTRHMPPSSRPATASVTATSTSTLRCSGAMTSLTCSYASEAWVSTPAGSTAFSDRTPRQQCLSSNGTSASPRTGSPGRLPWTDSDAFWDGPQGGNQWPRCGNWTVSVEVDPISSTNESPLVSLAEPPLWPGH